MLIAYIIALEGLSNHTLGHGHTKDFVHINTNMFSIVYHFKLPLVLVSYIEFDLPNAWQSSHLWLARNTSTQCAASGSTPFSQLYTSHRQESADCCEWAVLLDDSVCCWSEWVIDRSEHQIGIHGRENGCFRCQNKPWRQCWGDEEEICAHTIPNFGMNVQGLQWLNESKNCLNMAVCSQKQPWAV